MSDAAPAAARRHALVAGLLCYGFDAVDFMMLALAMPLMISEWHLTLGQAGLMGTAGMMGVGLSGLVLGRHADRHGRRRALLASVALFAIATAAVALARSRWDVMALRFVAGLGLGGVWGAVTALIHETWPRERRTWAISWVLGAWPVGVSVAALAAGSVLPAWGWRGLFALGALALLAALYVRVFVPESAGWQRAQAAARQASAGQVAAGQAVGAPSQARVGTLFSVAHARHTLLGTAVAACGLIGYWGVNTWLPTWLVRGQGLDAAAMSRYVLVLNAGMFCGYPLLAGLAGRIGTRRALLASYAYAAIAIPLYASLRDLDALLWAGPLVALGFSQAGLLGAYFPALYPVQVRALGAGFCFNVGRGIAALSPYAMGQLAGTLGLAHAIGLCGAAYAVAGVAMAGLPVQPPHEGECA